MTRPALPLPLSLEERLLLEDMLRSHRTSERLRVRCQIILMGADGLANTLIAERLRVTRSTVLEWRRRFEEGRVPALAEKGGETSLTKIRQDRERQIRALLETLPLDGSSAWTVRALAKAADCSPATVQRMLEAADLRAPHRRPQPQLNLNLLAGTVDVAGFFLQSPYHTVALEVDPALAATAMPGSLPAVQPGDPAWFLHLHLRSLEGLRQLEPRSTYYSSTFWNFLSGLRPKTAGTLVWCLTDTPLHPEYLRHLEAEKNFLRITCMEPGLGWLDAMKQAIIPALQAHAREGLCPSLQESVKALESFIRNGTQDPLQWCASA